MPLATEANRLWVDITARYGAASTGFTAGGILVPAETDEDEARIADGLACSTPHAEALEHILRGAERIVRVSDDEVEGAMRAYSPRW